MKITQKPVMSACFKQESILFWHGFPTKTLGKDKLQHPQQREIKADAINITDIKNNPIVPHDSELFCRISFGTA
jgi:hypothetical protein